MDNLYVVLGSNFADTDTVVYCFHPRKSQEVLPGRIPFILVQGIGDEMEQGFCERILHKGFV